MCAVALVPYTWWVPPSNLLMASVWYTRVFNLWKLLTHHNRRWRQPLRQGMLHRVDTRKCQSGWHIPLHFLPRNKVRSAVVSIAWTSWTSKKPPDWYGLLLGKVTIVNLWWVALLSRLTRNFGTNGNAKSNAQTHSNVDADCLVQCRLWQNPLSAHAGNGQDKDESAKEFTEQSTPQLIADTDSCLNLWGETIKRWKS